MAVVLDYLGQHAPNALETARHAFRCFEPYREDVQTYALSTALAPDTCEDEVVALLREVQQQLKHFPGDPEAAFNAEQNALVAVDAERYYRTMLRGNAASWNVRDRHMADTLDRLMTHHGPSAKAIVWAHNTHIGDARATDMAQVGMTNVGELVRERHAADGVMVVGFSAYQGTVIAGDEWGAPMQRMRVPNAQAGSWEDVLHRAGATNKLLLMSDLRHNQTAYQRRGHRYWCSLRSKTRIGELCTHRFTQSLRRHSLYRSCQSASSAPHCA